MNNAYHAELHISRHLASVSAVQAFFESVCENLEVPRRIQLEVELALEEGLVSLFQYAVPEDSTDYVKIRLEFSESAIRIVVRSPGRPIDVDKIPQYQPLLSPDDDLSGLSSFLVQKFMDSVQWRNVEKEGQELVMTKHLPSPIGEAAPIKAVEERLEVVGEISYRMVNTIEDARALATAAWEVYRYTYKDVFYYPQELVGRCQRGQIRSWIAVDEAGTVLGHYAMIKHEPEDLQAEMGAAFVRPEVRHGGAFKHLSDIVNTDAAQSGVRSLYSLSVTSHVATQKSSEAAGRRSVGLRLASTPSIFVVGGQPGHRVTSVLNYHQLAPREPRRIYPPPRHREIILRAYDVLGIPVEASQPVPDAVFYPDVLEYHHDLTWNRATIEARGGDGPRYRLAAFTNFLLEQGIAALMLSIDLEDPNAPALAAEAEKLGFFYSGLFPESCTDGHDAVQFQFLNGVTVDPDEIQLYQPSAKELMDYIVREAPHVFSRSGECAPVSS